MNERLRLLTFALFISGSFNILLLAFLFHWAFKEQPPTLYCELKPKQKNIKEVTLATAEREFIRQLKALKFDDLLLKLSDNSEGCKGFKVKELALATLVTFHDFDLKKALARFSSAFTQKLLVFGEEKLLVFTGMSDEQFAAITDFANREKWPFRGRGLFQLLKKESLRADDSLMEAFTFTPEFSAVRTLFLRDCPPINNRDLLKVILEGDWGLISAFCERQRKTQDLSAENRQRFLLDYIRAGSKAAAYLLLMTNGELAVNRLNDKTVFDLLALLEQKNDDAKRFASKIAASPRGEAVRQLAERRLTEYLGSRPAIQEKVLTTLKPKEPIKINPPVKRPLVSSSECIYIVQEGDSLWKISQKFRLKVENIKNRNHLASDLLQPGTVLHIPYG